MGTTFNFEFHRLLDSKLVEQEFLVMFLQFGNVVDVKIGLFCVKVMKTFPKKNNSVKITANQKFIKLFI